MEDLGIAIRQAVLDEFLDQHVNKKSMMYWNRSPFAKRAVSRLNPTADTFAPKMLDFSLAVEEFEPTA
jgi:hypothetical protein